MVIFGTTKMHIKKVTDTWLEGSFEWPKALGYEDDDAELLFSLVVVWNYVPWQKIDDADLWRMVQSQLDSFCALWLLARSIPTASPTGPLQCPGPQRSFG